MLHSKFIELLIVKATEFRCQAAERSNEPQLRGKGISEKTEPHLLRKGETVLSFDLHPIECIAGRKKVRVQVGAAVSCKSEVADLVCCLEGATHQVAASPNMPRPREDVMSKDQVGPGLVALQPALFDQLIAEPAEPGSGLVVAEVRSGECAKHLIGDSTSRQSCHPRDSH